MMRDPSVQVQRLCIRREAESGAFYQHVQLTQDQMQILCNDIMGMLISTLKLCVMG